MGQAQDLHGSADRESRRLEELVDEHWQQRRCPWHGYPVPHLCPQVVQPVGSLGGVPCLLLDDLEEKAEPGSPVTLSGDAQQQVVVPVTSRLDVGGQVQYRTGQQSPLDQQQDHEQAAHATITVDERVDRLELVVQGGDV